MSRRSWSLSLSSLACLLLVAAGHDPSSHDPSSQDPKPQLRRPDARALRRAQELARPTPQHKVLERLAGNWKVAMRTMGPDGKPHEEQGAVAGQMMLGGRYLALNFRLALPQGDLEALQILGFDTLRQLYTASWRDTGTTWSVDCEGGVQEDPGVLELIGRMVDAFTPQGRAFRLQIDTRAEDEVTVRIYEGQGTEEVRVQEQRWTR